MSLIHDNRRLISRFAAPTSAGILFTMLAAAGLKKEWIYKKTQVLAIFDDLDTILLMIPLQILMICRLSPLPVLRYAWFSSPYPKQKQATTLRYEGV